MSDYTNNLTGTYLMNQNVNRSTRLAYLLKLSNFCVISRLVSLIYRIIYIKGELPLWYIYIFIFRCAVTLTSHILNGCIWLDELLHCVELFVVHRILIHFLLKEISNRHLRNIKSEMTQNRYWWYLYLHSLSNPVAYY